LTVRGNHLDASDLGADPAMSAAAAGGLGGGVAPAGNLVGIVAARGSHLEAEDLEAPPVVTPVVSVPGLGADGGRRTEAALAASETSILPGADAGFRLAPVPGL